MNLVKQTQPMGCYVAALAMLTDLSYDEVKARFSSDYDFDKNGITHYASDAFLAEHGYALAYKWEHDQVRKTTRQPWPPEPWADVHLCEVVVDPKKGAHAVIMLKDGRIYDPHFGELPNIRNSYYIRTYFVAAVYKVA